MNTLAFQSFSRSHSEPSMHRLRAALFHRKSIDISSTERLKKVFEKPAQIIKDAVRRTKSLKHRHNSCPPALPSKISEFLCDHDEVIYDLPSMTLLMDGIPSPGLTESEDDYDSEIRDFIIPTSSPVITDDDDSSDEEDRSYTPQQLCSFQSFRDFETSYFDNEYVIPQRPQSKETLNNLSVAFSLSPDTTLESSNEEPGVFYDVVYSKALKRKTSLESLESEFSLSRFLDH